MTVELYFSGRWLSGSAWPFGKHFHTFIVLHVFYGLAPPPKLSNTYKELCINVPYFQRKMQLSGFSAYSDVSPSQLSRKSGVLLYFKFSVNSRRPSAPLSFKCFLSFRFPHQNPVRIYVLPHLCQQHDYSHCPCCVRSPTLYLMRSTNYAALRYALFSSSLLLPAP